MNKLFIIVVLIVIVTIINIVVNATLGPVKGPKVAKILVGLNFAVLTREWEKDDK